MRLVALTLAFMIVFMLMGCTGGSAPVPPLGPPLGSPSTLHITWSSDGNTLIPICGLTLVNCKKSLVVVNTTTGTRVELPITQTSYDVNEYVPTDVYAVHVIGYDSLGNKIESNCCTVAVSK